MERGWRWKESSENRETLVRDKGAGGSGSPLS